MSTLYDRLLAEFDGNEELLNSKIRNEIEELSGLIDVEGALIIIANRKGISINEQQSEDELEFTQFVDKHKTLLQQIVDNSELRNSIYNAAPKYENDDFKSLYNFKFGLEENTKENYREGKIFSGEDYDCYIFIMSIKQRYSVQYNSKFTSVNVLLWEDINDKPIVVSIILPTFLSQLGKSHNYYTIFKVHYDGLIELENGNHYHKGSFTKVAKINKMVQSKLM